MKSITKALSAVQAHYKVIVIGSGYGGGVSASRMARAGQSVCLLERGKEILAPNFPDSISSAQQEIQLNTPDGAMGAATGLFDFKVNEGMNALVGCGLGGTSLINANVALEIDERVFDSEHWPVEYRNGELLKPYYDRARKMLGSTPYPRDDLNKLKALQKSAEAMATKFYKPPINVTFEDRINEFNVVQNACVNCGDCCSGCNYSAKNTTQMNYLPDAVNHGAEIFCQARVEKLSKHVDGTWAVHVTDLGSVEKPSADQKPLVISADKVVVCAGTFGSTEILLRSRSDTLKFSDQLGQRFSGNGDVLAFGYNNYWSTNDKGDPSPVYGIGIGANKKPQSVYPGPCITGIIDNRDSVSVAAGRVIEEGVIPGALAMAMPPALFFAGTQYGDFLRYGFKQAAARLKDAQQLGEVITGDPGQLSNQSYQGPVSRTQTYLVMSHDDSAGKLYLDQNDNIRAQWKNAGRSQYILKNNAALREANAAIQGQFIPNPLWSEALAYEMITVHPLGGCCMGEGPEQGVVNAQGEVFDGNTGNIHEGLLVLDGSVLPTSAGVNPLLTITAIAEYAIEKLAEKNSWEIDYDLVAARPLKIMGGDQPAELEPDHGRTAEQSPEEQGGWSGQLIRALKQVGLRIGTAILKKLVKMFPSFFSPGFSFTETMQGFVSEKINANHSPVQERISNSYELAFAQGKSDGNELSYKLTVSTSDLQAFIESHRAEIGGKISCSLISEKDLKVTKGRFVLFDPKPDSTETWTMNYRLNLESDDGRFYFEGNKYLHQGSDSHWWTDVTTLLVDIYKGDDSSGKVFARGVMTLDINDAINMAQTAKTPLQTHDHQGFKHLMASLLGCLIKKYPQIETTLDTLFLTRFAGFFAETIFKAYGGLLADLKNFPRDENQLAQAHRRVLRLPIPEIKVLTTSDGASIKLYRYRHEDGASRRQVILAPGFSVTADSFATATVDTNLVEYLYWDGLDHAGTSDSTSAATAGYDVWLFAYRASPDSENQLTDYTIDDIVDYDWPRAISYVLEQSGKESVSAIAHCVGSMSLLMALLKGLKGVDSVISSQLTLHPVTNWQNFLKADINLVELIKQGLPAAFPDLSEKIPLRPDSSETDKSAALDVFCWAVPVPEGEACKNQVCHRISAIFGPSYTHKQLNHETHIAMEEWFDEIALKPFEQLLKIVDKQHVVDAQGEDSYLSNVEKLKLPIHFLAGGANKIFLPETSLRTFEWLKTHNGHDYYSRKVFSTYAHMDFFIGRNASRDIYPYILEQLK